MRELRGQGQSHAGDVAAGNGNLKQLSDEGISEYFLGSGSEEDEKRSREPDSGVHFRGIL